ncbi:MAG: translation elongation factor Ts [Sphaerochaetaceae bacterium]|nr:translation elongation factor Ts [Sphaerochaetaceae bacterium]
MAVITMEMVKKLREETHAGIMDCKKALSQADGDFAAAAKYLKEVGLAAVEKRADRATEEGRITFAIGEKMAVIVNVTCETDFVARNAEFKKLGEEICALALQKGCKEATEEMEDLVKGLIATIHENMAIKGYAAFDVPANGYVSGYSHADGNIGVLVSFEASDKKVFENEAFKTLAFNTAMHVCAADPLYLDAQSVPKAYEEEQLSIFRVQVANMGKPEKVLEGIVKGKLNKHYADICLMNQVCQVYNDDGLTVAQLLAKFNKENGTDVKITGFQRMRAGA